MYIYGKEILLYSFKVLPHVASIQNNSPQPLASTLPLMQYDNGLLRTSTVCTVRSFWFMKYNDWLKLTVFFSTYKIKNINHQHFYINIIKNCVNYSPIVNPIVASFLYVCMYVCMYYVCIYYSNKAVRYIHMHGYS